MRSWHKFQAPMPMMQDRSTAAPPPRSVPRFIFTRSLTCSLAHLLAQLFLVLSLHHKSHHDIGA